MNKLFLASILLCAVTVRAEDLTGRLGAGGSLGSSSPIGSKTLTDTRDTDLGLGAWLRYRINERWGARATYDNLKFSRMGGRMEPLMAGLDLALMPESKWNPSLHGGIGAVLLRGLPGGGRPTVFGGNLGLGVDRFLCRWFSVGAAADWFWAPKNRTLRTDAHAVRAGLTAGLWFGGQRAAAKTAAAPAPVPAPAPAPAPAAPAQAVALSLTPASAELAAGGSQAFAAAVTGAENKGVTWAIAPALGSVSPSGVYSAPSSVAMSQDVTVTATSVADATKTASSVVHLRAAQTASIELAVRFDTAKSVVKPEYDAELKKVAEFMKAYASAKAEIEGHTDNVGKPEYNKDLSQKRADAVRQALIDRFGVDGARLTAKGYGQEKPLADNGTAEGRAKNRRVIATFTGTK